MSGSVEQSGPSRGRLRRRVGRVLVGLLTLVLATAGAGFWAQWHLANQLGRIEAAFPATSSSATTTDVATGPLNILLLLTSAVSSADGTPAPTWAGDDVDLAGVDLVHVSADRRTLSLVSLPDAAPPGSSPADFISATEATTGLHIDHLGVLDWAVFDAYIDDAGGIDVELPELPGVQHFDAAAARGFIDDHPSQETGAIGRSRRQQFVQRIVLESVLHQELVRNPFALFRVLDTMSHHLAIDSTWSVPELRNFVWSMRRLRSFNIRFIVAPSPDAGLWDAMRTDQVDAWMGQHPTAETPRRLAS